ncbi:TetR family transcriptional regulator [Pseudomonas sp. Irchel 3H3]|uniref:TetR family transcriptional regulator n=1 Tax=Pseudomonas sp. Irchel 3H3 TaxID=2009038 RepID=UPI0021143408|nr:TetR family transcriptional regulator [Pseudomonas sp. Irchel 3H3]
MNMTETNIRLAAIKLISRNGFESMSLRQLAAEAGINSSTASPPPPRAATLVEVRP